MTRVRVGMGPHAHGSLIRNHRRATRIRVVRGKNGAALRPSGLPLPARAHGVLAQVDLARIPGIVGLAYGLYPLGHEAPGWAAPGFLLGMVVCAIITFLGDAPGWVRFAAVAVKLSGALLLI